MYNPTRYPKKFSPRRIQIRYCAVLAACSFALLSEAGAATLTWSGGGSNVNWNNITNWGFAGTPTNGDTLVFPAGSPAVISTNNISGLVLNEIRFTGLNGDCDLRGNAFTITNSIRATNDLSFNTIENDITLSNTTITVEVLFQLTLSGALSGSVGLTKIGEGVLHLEGSGLGPGNTYAGLTTVKDGLLMLGKFAGYAIPGPFIIGDDIGADNSASVRLFFPAQFPAVDVTVNADGILLLNFISATVNNLTLRGGRVGSGSASSPLSVNGNIVVETPYPLDATSSITGGLDVGTGTQSISFPTNSLAVGAPQLQLDARVTGSALISVSGTSGDLFLNSSNDFTGGFTVGGGDRLLVHLGNDFALGANTAGTTNTGSSGFIIEAGAADLSEPLTLCGAGPIGNGGVLAISGSANWNTNVVLACDATINCRSFVGIFTINGVISGPGGLIKMGSGVLTFAGASGNTYAGTTTVNEGILLLNKPGGTAIPGGRPLVIGDGVGIDTVLQGVAGSQIIIGSVVTINSSGQYDLNGFSDDVGPFILNGGDIFTGTGLLTLSGNVTVPAGITNTSTINGRMSLGTLTRTFDVAQGPVSQELSIPAEISGSGGIIKNGSGDLSLSGSNTFSGLVTANSGILFAADDFALGTTNTGTIVQSNATLAVQIDVHVGLEPLTLDSTGTAASASLAAFAGAQSNSWAGAITMLADTTVRVDTLATLNLLGPITGSGRLTKIGNGTLWFSGSSANTYTNTTTVSVGTLVLNKGVLNAAIVGPLVIGDGLGGTNVDVVRLAVATQIDNNSAVTINSSGLLDQADHQDAVGSIAGSGNINIGNAFLNVGLNNSSTMFSGVISGVGGGSLNKLGSGTLTLAGNNTYDGDSILSAGTLLVNGLQPLSTIIQTAGTLGGTGTVGQISASGALSPGTSPGILNSSNVAFTASGTFPVELNGNIAGSGYDQLNVRGTNNLTGAALSVSVGFLPAERDQFRIINNDGAEAITGIFDGLPEGAVIGAGNFRFRVSYIGGTGNDVVLTMTNQFLKFGAAFVSSGNGNAAIEPNECNLLSLVISNLSGVTMTGLNATLRSLTPGVVVAQPFSSYPNIPSNLPRTNDAPFLVTTAPGFVCGANVNLELQVVTAAHGTLIVPFSLPSGVAGASVRFNNNTVTAIPDAGFVDSTVAVAGITTPVKKVVVLLHITHAADSDLDVSLIGPDGTTVELTSDNGGLAPDYGVDCTDPGRTTFDSSASTAITAGVAPFVGTFRPEQSLTSFNEKSGAGVNGLWTLRVVDDTPGAVGSIFCWSLILSPTACVPGSGICELCPDTTINSAIGGGLSSLQTNYVTITGIPGTCAAPKVCPGTTALASLPSENFTFRNGPTNACVTVTLENNSSTDMYSAAYLGSFNPANPDKCVNYLADCGNIVDSANPIQAYSFNVASNATFVVNVVATVGAPTVPYRLTVSGGDCRPALSISRANPTEVKLDWTTASAGYQLEQTNNLFGGSLVWPPITNVPIVINSRFTVTNSPAISNQYFRLRKPLP